MTEKNFMPAVYLCVGGQLIIVSGYILDAYLTSTQNSGMPVIDPAHFPDPLSAFIIRIGLLLVLLSAFLFLIYLKSDAQAT